VRHLHYLERGPVGSPPLDDRGGGTLDELVRSAVGVVGEEDTARRPEAVGHERPERGEAPGRNVGQPEAGEDHVVAAVGLPGEQIGLDEPDPVTAGAGCRQGEHLRGRVDGGHVGRVPQQLGRPGAGTAGELEHAAPGPERVERRDQLVTAGQAQVLVEVVRGQSPVVGKLLAQETAGFWCWLFAHAPSIELSPGARSTSCRSVLELGEGARSDLTLPLLTQLVEDLLAFAQHRAPAVGDVEAHPALVGRVGLAAREDRAPGGPGSPRETGRGPAGIHGTRRPRSAVGAGAAAAAVAAVPGL
jgi:hypothetical protein